MLLDLADIEHGSQLTCDLCIAGAGAAGLSLARALENSGLEVVLLESGGLDFETGIQSVGAGDNVGMPYYDLENSRLRFFGGTTNIWGGRCSPLNEMDFQHRSWVPHSGWPIDGDDLREGYRQAHQDLEIGEFYYGDELWVAMRAQPPEFSRDVFDHCFWRFDEQKERFSAARCGDLMGSRQIRVITHASVTLIQAASEANQIEHLRIESPAGNRARVKARAYVLACGGIENARLLLASRDVEAGGVGNRHDQVGRYFMEHPHGRLGIVAGRDPYDLWNRMRVRFPGNVPPIAPVMRASPSYQEKQGILNTALSFKLQKDPRRGMALSNRLYQELKHQLRPTRSNRFFWHSYRTLTTAYKRRLRPMVEHGLARLPGRSLCVMVRGEQAPNPDSRVRLSRRLDRFGMPCADLDWQLSRIDKDTVRQLAEALDGELQRLRIGRLEPETWIFDDDPRWPVDPTVGNHPIGGYHHMGTTRMSRDPRHGVVDRDCRVHGYGNLYITGSSVFPTGGWANPTLTILALVHRLNRHLRKNLMD